MANKKFLTDIQVEEEIARLSQSPYVKLARQQERIKYQRRQYLYGLRDLEKKGKKLYESVIASGEMGGLTLDMFEDDHEDTI